MSTPFLDLVMLCLLALLFLGVVYVFVDRWLWNRKVDRALKLYGHLMTPEQRHQVRGHRL